MIFRRTHYRSIIPCFFCILLLSHHSFGQDAQGLGGNAATVANAGAGVEEGLAKTKRKQAEDARLNGKTAEAERLEREATVHDTNAKAMKDAAAACQKSAETAAAGDEGGKAMPPPPAPPAPPKKDEEEKKEVAAAPTPAPTPAVATNTPAPTPKPNAEQQSLLAQIDQLKKETATSRAATSPKTSSGAETTARIAEIQANANAAYAATVQQVAQQQQQAVAATTNPNPSAQKTTGKPNMGEQLVSFDQRRSAGRAMADFSASTLR